MKVGFDRVEAVEFSLFGLVSIPGLILFSLTEEDGNALSPHMLYLVCLFIFIFGSLLVLIVYDVLVKSRHFPSPTARDKSSTSTVSSPDSFSILSEGLPTGFI